MKMKESKTTMISIKYTQQDKEYLLAAAQKAGCSLSEYIREKSLQGCNSAKKARSDFLPSIVQT